MRMQRNIPMAIAINTTDTDVADIRGMSSFVLNFPAMTAATMVVLVGELEDGSDLQLVEDDASGAVGLTITASRAVVLNSVDVREALTAASYCQFRTNTNELAARVVPLLCSS